MFDEVQPSNKVDGRKKSFREKLRKLGYTKKEKNYRTPYDTFNVFEHIETIYEKSEHEITVGGYTTTHFYMCGGAQKIMRANANVEGAEQVTKLIDDFFKLEKDVMDAGTSTDEQKKQAEELYNKIMEKAGEFDLADDIQGFMKQHIDSVLKLDPKPGFGRTDIEEDAIARAKEKKDLERKHKAEIEREKEEIKNIRQDESFDEWRVNKHLVNEKFKKRFVKNIKSIKKNARSLPLSRDYILNTDNLDKLTPMNNQMARAKLSTNYDHPKYGSGTEIETKKGAVLIKPEVAELYMKSRDRLPDPIKKNMDRMALRSPDGLFTVLQAALNDLQTGMIESLIKSIE